MQPKQTGNLKALSSLALMEAQVLSRDYLSTFLPFVATLVLKKKYDSIDIGIFVDEFREEYGISIPRAPMQSILSKAIAAGLIIAAQDGRYLPVISEMQKISFLNSQYESKIKIEAVLNRFIDFAKEKHNVHILFARAVDIFISFMDEYSPRTITGEGEYDRDDGELTRSNQNLYLMGDFIQSIVEQDVSLFDTVRELALSYLITTALTYDVPVERRTKDLSDITIYLDTPIILRLLGLHTEELERAYSEMFATFRTTINPTFMIFQHTKDEVAGIIVDCVKWIENPDYNPAYANPALLNFVKRRFNKTQVALYHLELETKLNEIGVAIDYQEHYNIVHRSAQIDIAALKQKLVEAYIEKNPSYDVAKNSNSIDYDVRSIENIVRLWGTKASDSYSQLGYLFMTNNATLAYVSRKFASDYWWDSKNHKTPCVTDYYLGTMVWLSTPAGKIENVSKLKLLADCSAATTLSRTIMEKFSYELEKLKSTKGIKDGDFLILRKFAYEKNYLQTLTLNDENLFKDDILEQLLEDIKADIQKPIIEKMREKDEQLNVLEQERVDQSKRIEDLVREKEGLQQEQMHNQKEVDAYTDKVVSRFINTYLPIGFAAFSFIAVVTQLMFGNLLAALIVKIVAACISFSGAAFFALTKSNFFGVHDRITAIVKKHYQVQRYKRTL